MKNEEGIIDWRSTGRRKARRSLFNAQVPYKCVDCHKTSLVPPKDAPPWFEDLWPEENRVLSYPLQADHESKDLTNNDPQFLNWRCAPCHKKRDSQTDKGESTVIEDYWSGVSKPKEEENFWG